MCDTVQVGINIKNVDKNMRNITLKSRAIMYAGVVVSVVFGFMLFYHSTYARDINVPSEYNTVKEALNAAQSGDTVRVAEGTYRETSADDDELVLKDGVKLLGAGAGKSILDITNITTNYDEGTFGLNHSAELAGFSLFTRLTWDDNGDDNSIVTPTRGENDYMTSFICANGNNTKIHDIVMDLKDKNGGRIERNGGIFANGQGTEIWNVTVKNGDAGVIVASTGGVSRLTNLIIVNDGGSGLDAYKRGQIPQHSYVLFYGVKYPYSDVNPDPTDMFADPKLDANMMPLWDSPALNAGNPDALYRDVDGTRSDIGGWHRYFPRVSLGFNPNPQVGGTSEKATFRPGDPFTLYARTSYFDLSPDSFDMDMYIVLDVPVGSEHYYYFWP
ncbi:MAG TPA: hypothetical protein DEG92_01630, partial [Rikenellaceae bacterium]|nr:hypothetical protein [Rikenellaceae bacterium]